jgi:hypothetical protein
MLQWELDGLPERMSDALQGGDPQRVAAVERLGLLLRARIDKQRQTIARLLLTDRS